MFIQNFILVWKTVRPECFNWNHSSELNVDALQWQLKCVF